MQKQCALLFIGLALLGQAGPVYPQCGPGGCSVPQLRRAAQADDSYRWVTREDMPSEVYLFRGDEQVGGYSYATGFYRALNGNRWGPPAKAPIQPPFGRDQQDAGRPINFGLNAESIGRQERIWEGNHYYSAGEASKEIAADLPEDLKAGHVTGVAKTLARRNKMDADMNAARAHPGADKAKMQAYDFSHSVNQEILAPFRLDIDKRFENSGQVVIAQAAELDKEGRSKAKAWYEYSGADTWIEALRTVDPHFDPNKPSLPGLPGLPSINWEYVALIIVVCVLLVAAMRSNNS